MANIRTIGEFLRKSGMKYRVFSLGRRVTQLSPETFLSFEQATSPCPQPFQKRAFLGVIFWRQGNKEESHVWFLKFPLDEQGMLVQSARDDFLEKILANATNPTLAGEEEKLIKSTLKAQPYFFTPRNDKKIVFHALAKKSLKLPPSEYYADALTYFTGDVNPEEWQHLELEGVADLAVRLSTTDKSLDLVRALPKIPDKPFGVLSAFWEHASPDVSIIEVLERRVAVEVEEKKPNIERVIGCLRASSNSPAQGLVKQMVDNVLAGPCGRETEILAIIAGRCWLVLQQPDTCLNFVEQLAVNTGGQNVFNHIISDLIYLPNMRVPIMQALRSPEISNNLARAARLMFESKTGKPSSVAYSR